jgi:dolichyl-phosphate beta-glucosyltransferase
LSFSPNVPFLYTGRNSEITKTPVLSDSWQSIKSINDVRWIASLDLFSESDATTKQERDFALKSAKYSIVLPAYNESKRLGNTLEQIFSHIAAREWNAEVIVVDDGSSDQTAELVRKYAETYSSLRLLSNPGNRGKGYSVRSGMLHAEGEILLFSDADLSSPLSEAERLFAAIEAGADIAAGSRWVKSELQMQRQSLLRQLFGRIFNLAQTVILGLNLRDTQCGFKAFTREAAHAVFPLQLIEGWGFDPELLYLAKQSGLKVAEVPVRWAHQEGSRIRPVRDGLRMFGELLKIRWNAVLGRYAGSITASEALPVPVPNHD